MIIKKIIKNLYINYFFKIKAIKLTSFPFILMYHRVVSEPEALNMPIQPGMYVTRKTFEKHMAFLKKKYKVLPLVELLNNFYSGKEMNNCCAVTFDDGWEDNYRNAFKVIEEKALPASFFIATSFIDSDKYFWSEEVALFLRNSDREAIEELVEKHNLSRDIKKCILAKKLSLQEKITYTVQALKKLDAHSREHIINFMYEINNISKKCNNVIMCNMMLNSEQIQEMNSSELCEFFSHSHNHESLTLLNASELEKEIKTSLSEIRKYRGEKSLEIFSYPSGKTNGEIIEVLKYHNFNFAVGTKRGKLKTKANKFNIRRIGLHNDISYNTNLFRYCLSEKVLFK